MISKSIFKQSVQANWKLWVIITAVASIILSGFIISYDAAGYASIAAAAEGTAFSSILSSMTSLLGSLENFYKLIGVILGIVYVVFTANNLVVNEVDSGSMAYTLSTPIKRSSVIFTKSLYLILSVTLMYTIISLAGLGASHLQYKNVTGYPITDDIKAASETLNQDGRYISERLYLIQENEQALLDAATARDMDTDAYSIYLEYLINYRAYEVTAEIITDERWDIYEDDEDMEDTDIEITTEELAANPEMILTSSDALIAGARIYGISINEYREFVMNEIEILQAEDKNEQTEETQVEIQDVEEVEENVEIIEETREIVQNVEETREVVQNIEETQESSNPIMMITEDNAELLLQKVIDSSATALGMNREQISDNLTLVKNPTALALSTKNTGLNEDQIIMMANHAMVSAAKSVDEALDFDTEVYLWMGIGLLLLILAMSSISFFASTLFNRTGLALAIGGGIPFAFFLITMILQLMDNVDRLEYITLTSLFDTDAILTSGDFGWGLVALGVISLVLYTASNIIFTKKDLPL